MSDKTGGPAFPFTDTDSSVCEGMSLRDYFAIHADTSKLIISGRKIAEQIAGEKIPSDPLDLFEFEIKIIAKARYLMADAMLEARK